MDTHKSLATASECRSLWYRAEGCGMGRAVSRPQKARSFDGTQLFTLRCGDDWQRGASGFEANHVGEILNVQFCACGRVSPGSVLKLQHPQNICGERCDIVIAGSH